MTAEEVFLAALDVPQATARAAFLDETCGGDARLRNQVDSLLAAHFRSGEFLDVPLVRQVDAGTAPGSVDTGAEGPGTPDPDSEESANLDFLSRPTRPDSLGRLGHYEILQVLGKGGFGIVFRAFDDVLQRVVAIKVLAPSIAATSPARKRFLREARSSARVRHVNVVQVYAVEEQPLPYLVMEYIPGETLQQRLTRSGPLGTTETLQLGRQIAEGLAAAHATGLIHRDIKPANILIEAGTNPCVKITDFGLARAADDASLTQSGTVAGTPMYMAPEQALGDALDHRADLFSLGSVLYTMCSGRPPFRANNAIAVLKRVVEDSPRPIPEIIPEVPRWLCFVIARLHAKKPTDRIGTAREVADLLSRGLTDLHDSGRFPAPPAAPPRATGVPIPVPDAPTQLVGAPAPPPAGKPGFRPGLWVATAAMFTLLLVGLGVTEATGVTSVRGTLLRLFSPEGTLVVEVDDPEVSVRVDGSEIVITGAGAKEIRLKTGSYTVEATKNGKVVSRELVSVTKNGTRVVRISQEPASGDATAAAPGGTPPPAGTPAPEAAAAWTGLKPIQMKSEGGATLSLQADGSILVGGELPDKDVYTLTFRGLPAKIEALRLDVLPHATLPQQGPGRNESGEFILTAMKAQLDPPTKPGEPRVLTFAAARADNSRGTDSRVVFALDAEDDTGWVTEVGRPHFAVFELAEPVPAAAGTLLRVTLEFKHHDTRSHLGRFRLSVAADARAGRAADAAAWERSAAALPAADQVKAVVARLKELNPGFDGVLETMTEGGAVTEVNIVVNPVTDLSPLRALPGLKTLHWHDGPLADLSPLKGKALEELTVARTQVSDLTPIKGMKLRYLNCDGSKVSDVSVLKGMPLATVGLHHTPVSDLAPLKGLPLRMLQLQGSRVTDLRPLQGMSLEEINLTPGNITTGLDVLRQMKSLKTIGVDSDRTWPAAEFWERYDRGEFK